MLCYYIIELCVYLAFAVLAGLALLLLCARHMRRAVTNSQSKRIAASKPESHHQGPSWGPHLTKLYILTGRPAERRCQARRGTP
jgi:hypothetical protein